ncbi:MAG: hypothetical protein KC609_06640, partial [Myxococcales bacterium]|nr:hypothetical protein [Myxococcales bacterium]
MSSDAQTFEEIAAIEFIDDAAQQVAVQWPPAMIFKRRPRARPRPKNVHRTEEFPFEAYDESAAAAKVEKTAAVLPKRARPTPKRRTTSETHALALEGPPSIPEPESATEENLFELREEPTRPERLGAFLPQSSAAAQEARDDLAAPGVDAADADQDKARRPEKRRTTDLDLEPPEFDGAARSDEPDVGAGETTVPGDEIADVQRGEPTIAGAEPTIAGAEPTIAGAEPTIAGAEPTIAGAEPTLAGAEPTIAGAKPTIA